MSRLLCLSCLSLGLLACGDDAVPVTPTDATSDVVVDTGVDLGVSDAASDSGTKDAAADTTPDAACKLVKAYSSKNAACNACAEAKCCVEINGCLGDKRCDDDYVNCILACALLPADAGDAGDTTKACVAKCGVDFPAGKALYDAAIGCADKQCAKECG